MQRAVELGVLRVEAPFQGLLDRGEPGEPLADIYRFVLPSELDPGRAAQILAGAREVAWAEPDHLYRASWAAQPDSMPFFPHDPLFVDGSQWGLWNTGAGPFGGVPGVDIRAPEGWAITTGASTTLVGIVDTGMDFHHPELNPTLFDGRPRVARAYNSSLETEGTPDDSVGHGTMVAGIALALSHNGPVLDGRGVAGVCGGSGGDSVGCRIIAVKATPTRTIDALASELARGIVFATIAGARAINLSFGGDEDNATVRDAIAYAARRGATVVCGAGNGQDDRPQYPGYYARYGLGISVAALRSDGTLARFSSRGPQIDVAAPGENIFSTYLTYANAYDNPSRNFEYSSGTSFAAPFVTGLAGLAATLQPGLTDNEFQEFLRRTAEDRGPAGRDDTFGYGQPHAGRLLATLTPPRGFWRTQLPPRSWLAVGTDSVTLAKTGLVVEGCGTDGRYLATRYEVRAHVDLPPGLLLETPQVIVRTLETVGWSAGPLLEYNLGWGEAIPGTVTAQGFDVRTYVYEIAAPAQLCPGTTVNIGFVPVRPQETRFGVTVFGRLDAAPRVRIIEPAADLEPWAVDRPDTLRWTASDTDTITTMQVALSQDGGSTWLTIANLPGEAREHHLPAPCRRDGATYAVRVRAIDAHGGVQDQGEAIRTFTPDRLCRENEPPGGRADFVFLPVSPNPALSGTVFRFGLPELGAGEPAPRVGLTIFDGRGRMVRRVDTGAYLSGPREAVWDGRETGGRRVRPGVYFARLEVAGRLFVRRFVYLALAGGTP